MNNKPLRAVIYGRVSKNDESQDPMNQLKPLRDYANALQAEIVGEYVDLTSGGGSADRVNFLRMLDDADKGKFDLVLIWALDEV